ncbi:hypothetical protein ACP26C_17170 [Franconibacter helveticus 513]|uniref:hypothetical protein n=1 Tax=Franconibacter helveticus TaxID=357240 RepID=UPI00137A0763|nr:hypothetical protein [Franconibacter helveticus]
MTTPTGRGFQLAIKRRVALCSPAFPAFPDFSTFSAFSAFSASPAFSAFSASPAFSAFSAFSALQCGLHDAQHAFALAKKEKTGRTLCPS